MRLTTLRVVKTLTSSFTISGLGDATLMLVDIPYTRDSVLLERYPAVRPYSAVAHFKVLPVSAREREGDKVSR